MYCKYTDDKKRENKELGEYINTLEEWEAELLTG